MLRAAQPVVAQAPFHVAEPGATVLAPTGRLRTQNLLVGEPFMHRLVRAFHQGRIAVVAVPGGARRHTGRLPDQTISSWHWPPGPSSHRLRPLCGRWDEAPSCDRGR